MKWEYRLVNLRALGGNSGIYQHFSLLGKDGWRLLFISDKTAYFERPLALEINGQHVREAIESFANEVEILLEMSRTLRR